MYINFWYPLALATEVTQDKPLRVTVLCLPFVVFRDTAGQAKVLSDTCVHRGGALGLGKIRGDHVACFVLRRFRQGVFRPGLEVREVGFFPTDQLPEGTTPGTRRRIAEVTGNLPAARAW